jgi:hypothetical protein
MAHYGRDRERAVQCSVVECIVNNENIMSSHVLLVTDVDGRSDVM